MVTITRRCSPFALFHWSHRISPPLISRYCHHLLPPPPPALTLENGEATTFNDYGEPPRRSLIRNIHEVIGKQLAQMRCICKSWNALLSEPSFVKSHLHHSIHKKDEILLFFHTESYFTAFTARPFHSPNLEHTNLIKHPVNLQHKYSVIGSVNGLICFHYGSYNDTVVGIWNPSLSAMLTLPPFSLPSCEPGFGFGFDPKTDDYKVVKITNLFKPARRITQVEVYSMRKGSWESISQRFPSHIAVIVFRNTICVDGRLHWDGYINGNTDLQTIVAFDLGAETFCEIPLPDSILGYNWWYSAVIVLAGKLCVMSWFRDGEFEVWVMAEYGMSESWVKHDAFSQLSADIFPYGFTSRNEFLFLHGVHLNMYDPIAAKTKTFKIMSSRNSYIIKVVEYVDSLVWIEPPNRLQI